jgi:hypothetical protein
MFCIEKKRYFGAGDLKLLCGTLIQTVRAHFPVTLEYVMDGFPAGGMQATSDEPVGLVLA